MLRASCKASDIDIDMRVVVDPAHGCGVANYRELIDFTDALVQADTRALEEARDRLRVVAGDAGVVRAAAIVGNFQMMNRALDTLGATLGEVMPDQIRQMAGDVGIDPPAHWK
jgi:hypothetical protein